MEFNSRVRRNMSVCDGIIVMEQSITWTGEWAVPSKSWRKWNVIESITMSFTFGYCTKIDGSMSNGSSKYKAMRK